MEIVLVFYYGGSDITLCETTSPQLAMDDKCNNLKEEE